MIDSSPPQFYDTETKDLVQSTFVPILLLALAVILSLAVQGVYLILERQQLAGASTSLVPQEQAAAKVRASLEALATSTAKLATAGNPNARAIVDQLRSRGVTINPPATAKPP